MNILLTGGAGYIGSHTAVELIGRGHSVAIVDNLSNSKPEVLDRIERITGVKPLFYKCDVADKAALDAVFSDLSVKMPIDAVIHFAGYKAVGESVKKPLKYYRNNIDSTLSLVETMEKYSVKRLIFSSSATVYGMNNDVPFTEETPVNRCTNPYGWTKLMIEQILSDISNADTSFSIVLLRYFNPVGAHESGLIGEDPSDIPNNLMPYISQVAVGKLECLSIFGNDYPTPDGTGVRDYIHVTDLANGHVCAVEYAGEHTGIEVFNLGSGKGHSVLEIVNTFSAVNKVNIPYKIAPRRDGDIASSYADASKAERILGWKTHKTLADMCSDSWNWQKNNPNGY